MCGVGKCVCAARGGARVTSGMPASSTGIGNGRPITPVEATSTCSGRQFSSRATSSVMQLASAKPCSPVQAFALPEQITIARASRRGSRSRLTWTGAAQTRFSREHARGGARGESLIDDREVAAVRFRA